MNIGNYSRPSGLKVAAGGFPKITNMADFLKAIEGKDEIGINRRDKYTVITYNVAFPDTFDIPEALECRGIVFDNATGRVIRRPFHKFFNVGEKDSTQINLLAMKKIISVDEKLDGTMLSPMVIDDEIIWGTKRVAAVFDDYISQSPIITDGHRSLVRDVCARGFTPIFEFHDPEFSGSVIVIRYGKGFAKLLALRNMVTGEYLSQSDMAGVAAAHGVECAINKTDDRTIYEIVRDTTPMENIEGFVITFADGSKVKQKTEWYSLRHRIIDMFEYPRILGQVCLGVAGVASLDDITPYLTDEQKIEVDRYSKEFKGNITKVAKYVLKMALKYESKKSLGLDVKNVGFSDIVFKIFDLKGDVEVAEKEAFRIMVYKLKEKVLNKNYRYDEWVEMVRALDD